MTLRSSIRIVSSTLRRVSYHEAPVSPLFLFGRQGREPDIALQRAGVLPTTVLPDIEDRARAAAAVAGAVVMVIQVALAILIYVGQNLARVLVMIIATIDIGSAFAAWIARGGSLGLAGTLYALALDVLILLALSSQSAAAYARRNERAVGRPPA